MSKILVIGAGWEQGALIQTIKDAGHTIIATHPFLNNEGFPMADHFYVKDSRDIRAHLTIAQTHKIDAVITDNCDYSFYTASIVAQKKKLPFAGIRSAIYSNDKYQQRVACAASGIKQPEFRKVTDLEELKAVEKELGFPLILKPVDSRGTFGVTITRDSKTLHEAFFDAIANSPSHTLICERFIPGTLVTVDGFCFTNGHKSLAVASRKFEEGPKPVTKEIIYPARFSDSLNLQLLQNHEKVVKALGYHYGHTHGEYIVAENNEIYLVECTNRGGGVYTSSVIVPLITGIDLNLILMNQSLGIDTYTATGSGASFMQKSVMLTFLDYEVGKVIKHINTEAMKQKSHIVRFRSIYGENDMVEAIENCASRHSMLVIEGKNVENTLANFNQFKKDFLVEYY
jgi:biotin carboxylase